LPSPGAQRDKFPRKFGNYHLLGPLAQGGMGALYLAATGDRGLERLLVIKTVLPHLADDEYVARFRDEAKVVVKLSHGNLIPVFDAGQVDGELFLAMDFVEGKDLRAMWNRCAKKQVAFPVDVAVYIVKELCRGLGYAHSFGDLELVHRDVSPPNVLISYAGEVKLTDFGLAASTLKLEKTAPGIIYGKVAYMSPEQARGEKLDGRSDLYATGIILWELLTGRQLFPPGAEQPQDLLKRARDPEVLAPSKRAPRVPPALDQIVVRALAADRDDRYASCEEFREALSGWLATEAPGTDAAHLETFMHKLFAEDIESERTERARLLDSTRERAMTLPPTDELRRMVEESQGIDSAETRRKVRRPGLPGRRASDHDPDRPNDRRRNGPKVETARGVAVDVPKPGKGGRTVLTPPPGGSAALAAAARPDDDADPNDSIDFLGQILDGRYQVSELIGEGGMGRVYLAEHVEIGKRVAIKILHPVYGRMPDLVERFRREARAASKIGHPHIVDVTDSGTTADGSVYFVMEHLDGVELASVIDREGSINVTRSLRIGIQICRALAAAHAAGIIHRDLKPENVFLTHQQGASDFVKVLDFGIAKSTEAEQARDKRLTSPGMAMGTPEYMSPEQAAGRPADERCDIYSLGAILYESLTGVPPYEGENFMEILTKKATVDPRPPQELRPDLPDAVADLVVRAMSRNPEERPRSMAAFEYELTKCLSGRGAAVAQIIGLAVDSQLIASVNPGVAVSLEEQGLAGQARRGGRVTPAPQLVSPPGGTPAPRLGYDSAGTLDGVEATVSIAPPRSSIGLFGWIVLVALVFTGIGVVLFVATGERGGRGAGASEGAASFTAPAQPEQPAAQPAVEPAEPPDEAPPAADAPPDQPDEHSETPAPAADRDHKKPAARRDRKSGSDRKPVRVDSGGAPRNRAEAKELLKRAGKHKARIEWAEAKALYQRVASGRHLRARGYLGLAKVSFETKNTDDAIKYAKKALSAGARTDAWMILGHAYVKRGDYTEALGYYQKVLAREPGNEEAQGGAALARKKLGR
jgi:serine/threonine protein kinase